ncbi:MAG: hypothetical protein JRJ12_10275 [Deltaproteobacteria bacterium]|nr:hypothetical protein [Deltaproteobacteria bacterium]MBW2070616.1 hypothetical protein [Deltaproteobacteria bacterium]
MRSQAEISSHVDLCSQGVPVGTADIVFWAPPELTASWAAGMCRVHLHLGQTTCGCECARALLVRTALKLQFGQEITMENHTLVLVKISLGPDEQLAHFLDGLIIPGRRFEEKAIFARVLFLTAARACDNRCGKPGLNPTGD